MSAEKIQSAAHAVSTAAMVLRMEEPTIKAFLKECRDMEDFGSVVNPTLYRDPQRKAVSAIMEPLFKAAANFLTVYDEHVAKAKAALEKVA